MANNTYTPPKSGIRDLETRGLSTSIPKANIVRIEVLDGNSRQRYLGEIQRTADIELKSKLYQDISSPDDRVFYGFMNDAGNTGLNLAASWDTVDGGGALMRVARGLVSTGTQMLGAGIGAASGFFKAGRAGVIAGADKGNSAGRSLASGIQTAADEIGNIVNELAGINASSTGGGTVKTFKKVDLQDYTIKCAWYLPEQYNLCTKSLKVLYRMAYPKQLDVKNIQSTDFLKALADTGSSAINVISENTVQKVVDKLGLNSSEDNPEEKNIQTPPQPDSKTQDGSLIKDFTQEALGSFVNISKAFGSNFTFNPLPVRLCVGQYMDVEPLVIVGVNTQFSKETFVNGDGRHLPIFVDTTISFKFWLAPAPDLNFVSILGEEVFGPSSK